ncbi:MAG: murein biosynthesis integral membrane protein MurJ, partial [Planctomycetes bacterium]|nr:murein biosynthesis integral membrane protein MurJ [Planctomycetota bacterium]
IAESLRPHPAVRLTMILMPYTVLICGTAFLAGVLNSLNRFAAPALAPILLNVILIAATWLGGEALELQPEAHLRLIAYSVLVAGVLQAAIQVVWLRGCGFSFKPNFDWSSPGVRRVMTLILPMILGISAIQLNTFIDSMIALVFVSDGKGPAVLGYAQYLSQLPLGVFSTAIATAIFPMLSQRSNEGDMAGFTKSLEAGIRTSLFIAIPAGVGLILVAPMLIRVLFERGEFQSTDTQRVAAALGCYCLGLWAYSLQQILVRGYYAREDMKTPVRISLVMVALNFVLNIILVQTSLREAGVALATAISATLQVSLLAIYLKKRVCVLSWSAVAITVIKSVFATAVMSGVVWILTEGSPIGAEIRVPDWLRLSMCVGAGAITYALAAKLTRADELRILMSRK